MFTVLKWIRRISLVLLGYLVVHIVVSTIENGRVNDDFIETKKDSDGPLVMKYGEKALVNDKVARLISADNLTIQSFDAVTYQVPVLPREFHEDLRLTASQIQARTDDFILFTLINSAYLNLTLNWLCNVAQFPSKIHRKTLIVSLDKEACGTIKKDWPKLTCLSFVVPDNYNAALAWGHKSYINLLTLRAQIMLILAELELPYILFETDAVWLKDPMEFFRNQTIIDDADIVVPIKSRPHRSLMLSFDPMIVYPTNASRYLMKELVARLIQNAELYDQDVLDSLCRQQYHGVVCRRFEWNDVADGKWFKLSEAERANLSPYIVNNNYYVGVKNKESRQALNGLWFLSTKKRCSASKTRATLGKYNSLWKIEDKAKEQKMKEMKKQA